MRSIQQVKIHRAEGPTDDPTMRPALFSGDGAEEAGNEWLCQIAETAPATGGYDKTDVSIIFSDGSEVDFRFDVQHTSLPDNDTNIRKHVRAWFLYLAHPEQLPHIANDPRRLEFARRRTTPEQKAAGESMLALLDADPPPFQLNEAECLRLEIAMCRKGMATAEAILNDLVNHHVPTARPMVNQALAALAHTDPNKSATAKAWLDSIAAPITALRPHNPDCAQSSGGECTCGAFAHNEAFITLENLFLCG